MSVIDYSVTVTRRRFSNNPRAVSMMGLPTGMTIKDPTRPHLATSH